MKLPKLELPLFETTLPVSGKVVKYRPYTVKEEKIILLATSTGDTDAIELAATQVLENCCSVEVTKLNPTDVEWLFLKLRTVSVGQETTIDFPVTCTTPECPESIRVKLNLETGLEIRGRELLEGKPEYIRKKDGWMVMFTEDIGIIFDVTTSLNKNEDEVMWQCFKSLFDKETVITKAETTKEDVMEYLNDLPRPFANKIEYLFLNQPWIVAPIKAKCTLCGKVHEVELTGILDFLE